MATTTEVLRAGPLEIRPSQFFALADGHGLFLSRREVQVLAELARRENQLSSREDLYEAVWGKPMPPGDRNVDFTVAKVRRKLEEALPEWTFIHTHWRLGYRFAPELHKIFTMQLRARNK
jgi:DNA-binding response OmpR family regulator